MADDQPTFGPTTSSTTRASIFVKLKSSDTAPRELAWKQFYDRYASLIADYAKRKGATPQQADEVVQNIVTGFFEASPRFVYDPQRGHFRGYLKACVARALGRLRQSSSRRLEAIPVEELDVPDPRAEDDELWERLWKQQILRRAVEITREHYTRKGKLHTFLAFEQNVLLGISAPETAKKLGMNVASVHTAKLRVTEKLKEIRATIEDEEG